MTSVPLTRIVRPRRRQGPVLAARGLAILGSALSLAVVALLVTLSQLPTGFSASGQTVSVGVYGPYGWLVRLTLLLFGLGALAIAATLVMRLHGRMGRICGALCGVWAVASTVDAFVATSPPHHATVEGAVHISLALTGLLAQLVLAAAYPVLLRHRQQRVSILSSVTTALVLGSVAFFIVTEPTSIGLGERALFATCALWMVVNVHLAGLAGPGTVGGAVPSGVRASACQDAKERSSAASATGCDTGSAWPAPATTSTRAPAAR